MNRWKLAVVVGGTVVLGACNEAPAPMSPEGVALLAVSREPSHKIAGRHVFTMHGGRTASEIVGAVEAAGGTIHHAADAIGVVVVNGLSDGVAARIASGKASVSNDLHARWVPTLQAMAEHTAQLDALPVFEAQSLRPPQTAQALALQWNIKITDTNDAWNQGKTGIPTVRVAILDTGLDAYHLDQFGLIDTQRSFAFVPSKTGPPLWEDDHFHGTNVGGIVTSNNFVVAGVAPNVTLVAVKVLDNKGDGNLGDVILGIVYAADVGVDVINLSLGATFPKNEVQGLVPAFNRAVNYAHSKGVFIAAASGNDGEDLQHNENRISVPCETGVLSCVSATGSLDLPAAYTNYGTNAINNAAPGGDFTQGLGDPAGGILGLCASRSTEPALAACRQVNTIFGPLGIQYVWVEGTSAAAPHIAAVGALLDSQFGGALNGSQILTAIQQNADDLGKPGADEFYGKGRMNTCRTLRNLPDRPNGTPNPDCVPVANP